MVPPPDQRRFETILLSPPSIRGCFVAPPSGCPASAAALPENGDALDDSASAASTSCQSSAHRERLARDIPCQVEPPVSCCPSFCIGAANVESGPPIPRIFAAASGAADTPGLAGQAVPRVGSAPATCSHSCDSFQNAGTLARGFLGSSKPTSPTAAAAPQQKVFSTSCPWKRPQIKWKVLPMSMPDLLPTSLLHAERRPPLLNSPLPTRSSRGEGED